MTTILDLTKRTTTAVAVTMLEIERLATDLEKCASVDGIKDVRDRAMSSLDYWSRKKAGGQTAAQAAGRIVTEATLMLAKLYAEETSAKGRNQHEGLDCDQDPPGKKAIAEAAQMDPAALSRLGSVVAAPKPAVRAAMEEIEARGEVVTPSALKRELTAPKPSPKTSRARASRAVLKIVPAVRSDEDEVAGDVPADDSIVWDAEICAGRIDLLMHEIWSEWSGAESVAPVRDVLAHWIARLKEGKHVS
jgi:hypothetical protein